MFHVITLHAENKGVIVTVEILHVKQLKRKSKCITKVYIAVVPAATYGFSRLCNLLIEGLYLYILGIPIFWSVRSTCVNNIMYICTVLGRVV